MDSLRRLVPGIFVFYSGIALFIIWKLSNLVTLNLNTGDTFDRYELIIVPPGKSTP